MSDESNTPPKATSVDHIHTLARAGISSIPIIGGAGVELFQMLVTPSLEKRKLEWMESVADGLQRLEEKHANIIDDLKGNDAFIDTVLQLRTPLSALANKRKKKHCEMQYLMQHCLIRPMNRGN